MRPSATFFFILLVAMGVFLPSAVRADGENSETQQVYFEKSVVREVVTSSTQTQGWSDRVRPIQTIKIEVLEGHDVGTTTVIKNEFTQLKLGEVFYVRHAVGGFDPELWSVADPYRLNILMGVGIVFIILLLVFGGIQGVRGLASLVGSVALIFYVLIPNIYAGHSPILISIGVASMIIIAGSYITHGFNRTTTMAMLGMLATVSIVGIATYLVIHAARFTGYSSEETVSLTFATQDKIDVLALLFGGIMIGLLGVLYDIAIGQAITVEELVAAGRHYSRKQVLTRALRVGREHIGALVNTLAIAYVGASLPLLLLLHNTTTNIAYIINGERFASEILRILMGSIGIILAVPITTLLATYILYGKKASGISANEHHHH